MGEMTEYGAMFRNAAFRKCALNLSDRGGANRLLGKINWSPLIYGLMTALSFAIAFPFLWMLMNSLKTKDEIWALPPRLFPVAPQWQNYADALSDGMFFRYMWNSVYTSICITLFTLLNSAMFAYAITHIRFYGRNILFIVVMITYIMPPASTYVPSYILLAKLGLINSPTGYMLSCAANILNIFFFRQTFLQINRSVLEAARIDGAGHHGILWRIIVPMSGSAFAAMGVLDFIMNYNSYMWPSLILKRKAHYLVSMGLRSFFSSGGAYGMKWGAIMAACCVVVIPLLLIFALGGRWVIKTITHDSSVKE
ncbi:MAG: carbohydrate ABC transporter permease [Spirochaetaceae bacterium]|jgi:multiple sugar transport system permease protein|nr:carbohydrate ABC transporter permease [Spirochaetaceae bacterium]